RPGRLKTLASATGASHNAGKGPAGAAGPVTSPATPGPVMPPWLVTALVLLLGTAAVIQAVAWWGSRKNRYLLGAGAALALAALVWVIDAYLPSDQRQIENALKDMEAAVKRHDTEGVFKHIAADFALDTRDRKTFRQAADGVLRQGIVDDVVVY